MELEEEKRQKEQGSLRSATPLGRQMEDKVRKEVTPGVCWVYDSGVDTVQAEKTFLSPLGMRAHTHISHTYRHTCAHCVWDTLVCSHVYAFTHVYTLKHTSLQIHVHKYMLTQEYTHMCTNILHMHIFMRSLNVYTRAFMFTHSSENTYQTPGRICTHIHT